MNEEAAVIWETVGGSKPSKRPLFQCNQAEKCCLIICLFHEWRWNKEADFSLLHQLTFLLSACTGGSKALERSAIFCTGANKETVSFFIATFFVVAIVPYYPACVCNTTLWQWSCRIVSECYSSRIHRLSEWRTLRLPSAGSHSVAPTPTVQSWVWLSADGLAVWQNRISFNYPKTWHRPLFVLVNYGEWKEKRFGKLPLKSRWWYRRAVWWVGSYWWWFCWFAVA